MSRIAAAPGEPPELHDALKTVKSLSNTDPLPISGIYKLLCLARKGHGDYTWGYRIYRTTYKDGTGAKFARAIEVLNEWIRDECLNRMEGCPWKPLPDNKANEQLWQRLRHEIVEDRELLEGAAASKLLALHQEWVHLHLKAVTGDSPRYRFFLVVDDEVLGHLLQLRLSELSSRRSIPAAYSIRVFDARYGSTRQFSGGESDSDSHSDSDGETLDDYIYAHPNGLFYEFEGWWWASASNLGYLWFCQHNHNEELVSIDYSWGGVKRYVHGESKLGILPLGGS